MKTQRVHTASLAFFVPFVVLGSLFVPIGRVTSHVVISNSGETFKLETQQAADVSSASLHQSILERLTSRDRAALVSKVHYMASVVEPHLRSTRDARRLAVAIATESFRSNFDPLYVAAIVAAESRFNRHARSNRGALGLMQLLPSTAKYISSKGSIGFIHDESLTEIDLNLRLGISYLKYLDKMFRGNKEHVLIAYNWGPGNLLRALKHGLPIPGSTKGYAEKIINTHARWVHEHELFLAKRSTPALSIG